MCHETKELIMDIDVGIFEIIRWIDVTYKHMIITTASCQGEVENDSTHKSAYIVLIVRDIALFDKLIKEIFSSVYEDAPFIVEYISDDFARFFVIRWYGRNTKTFNDQAKMALGEI